MPADRDLTERTGDEPMSAEQLDDETREQQRLLALLALTSRELPRNRPETRTFHDHMDADDEAFEALVAQYRAGKLASASKVSFRMRIAAGIAAVGVLATLLLMTMWNRETPLQAALDRSYAELVDRIDEAALTNPTSPRTQPGQLGFSSAQRASAASRSFAAGIAQGEARLSRSQTPVAGRQSRDSYYILGQWSVLLSAAARTEQPPSFWLAQRDLGRMLAEGLNEAGASEQALSHVRKLETLLAVLANGNSARTEYELTKELALFRAHFAPSTEQPR